MAKKILGDQKLSTLATEKFKSAIEGSQDHKVLCADTVLTDLLEQREEEEQHKDYEAETL